MELAQILIILAFCLHVMRLAWDFLVEPLIDLIHTPPQKKKRLFSLHTLPSLPPLKQVAQFDDDLAQRFNLLTKDLDLGQLRLFCGTNRSKESIL